MSATQKVRHIAPEIGRQIPYEIFPEKDESAHPPVDISIAKQDTIHWFCRSQRFRVIAIYPERPHLNAHQPLFYRRFPEDNLEFAYNVNSGPARIDASIGVIYKPIFQFEDGKILDPHIRTNP
jgi:hypothetical protein